jgi:hypothetical protein
MKIKSKTSVIFKVFRDLIQPEDSTDMGRYGNNNSTNSEMSMARGMGKVVFWLSISIIIVLVIG